MRNKTKGWLMLAPLIAAFYLGFAYASGGWTAVVGVLLFVAVLAWVIKAIDFLIRGD